MAVSSSDSYTMSVFFDCSGRKWRREFRNGIFLNSSYDGLWSGHYASKYNGNALEFNTG